MRQPSLSERIYRGLLLLLPADFRLEYREEIEELFRLRHLDAAGPGPGGPSARAWRRRLLRLWLRAAADLARSAPREHWDALVQDVRFAARGIRRNPGVTAVVVGTFALAIGANTAIFSVAHATLLRPLPMADEERLVRLVHVRERPDGGVAEVSFSRRDFHAVAARAESVASVAAQVYQGPALGTGDGVERVVSIGVSGSWFRTLGLEPALGRAWARAEEPAGRESRLAVLSDGLWRRRFGADPAIVGRPVVLDGVPHTVVGVMPAGFAYPYGAEMWRLWDFDPDEGASHNLNVQARLAPGVSLAEAQAELDLLSEVQARAYPETSRGYRIAARPTRENLIEGEDRLVLLLVAGVGLVLLIAAANLVGLLMARTVARSRELAVRASLGASAWRRARQLTTENVVLALLGGAAGCGLSAALRGPLTALLPIHVRELFGVLPFDRSALAFGLLLALAAGTAVGLLTASSARRIEIRAVLQGTAEGPRGRRALRALVVAESALTVTLLVGALFLSLDLYRTATRDPGFETGELLTAGLSLPEEGYASGPPRLRLEEELVERIRALPGVERAAIANLLPFADSNWLIPFELEGEGLPPEQAHLASFRQVTPGYFATLGIPVLRGRGFGPADRAGAPPVALVDWAMAERYWPGEDPVGRRVTAASGSFAGRSFEVIGVVGDVGDPRREPIETLYAPMAQTAIDSTAFDIVQPALAVRTAAGIEPASVVPALRSAVQEVDPRVPLFGVSTSADALGEALAQRRTAAVLAIAFAACGLLLAAVGTYGVVAYTVSRGIRDFGVRMALGASRGRVLRGVLARGGLWIASGVAVGLAAAAALSPWLAGSLESVGPAAPGPYAAAAGLLGLLGLAACLEPAYRATRADPAQTLREG